MDVVDDYMNCGNRSKQKDGVRWGEERKNKVSKEWVVELLFEDWVNIGSTGKYWEYVV